ncbi:MAG: GNAT family N-acetyltransferase [Cryobacterium sp.]|nr:GNAT family N-acetyltransferase [Cryobacterium sp.]
MAIETLASYQEDARAWVACVLLDIPVRYIIADEIDHTAHIEQVTVDPSHARKRLGSALIAEVDNWSIMRDLSSVTLTTFESVSSCRLVSSSSWSMTPVSRMNASTSADGFSGQCASPCTVIARFRFLHRWGSCASPQECP